MGVSILDSIFPYHHEIIDVNSMPIMEDLYKQIEDVEPFTVINYKFYSFFITLKQFQYINVLFLHLILQENCVLICISNCGAHKFVYGR